MNNHLTSVQEQLSHRAGRSGARRTSARSLTMEALTNNIAETMKP